MIDLFVYTFIALQIGLSAYAIKRARGGSAFWGGFCDPFGFRGRR